MAGVRTKSASVSGYFAAVSRAGLDRRVVVLAGLAAVRFAMEEGRLEDVARGYDDLEALVADLEENPDRGSPFAEEEGGRDRWTQGGVDPDHVASVAAEALRLTGIEAKLSDRAEPYGQRKNRLSLFDPKYGLTYREQREVAAGFLYQSVTQLTNAAWYLISPRNILQSVRFAVGMAAGVIYACGDRSMATPTVPVAEYQIVQVVDSAIRSLTRKRA